MINNTNVENKYTTNGVLETVYPITFQGAVTDSGTPHLNIVLKTADGTSTRQLVYNVDYELVHEEIDPSAPQTESMGVPPVIGIKLLNAEDAAAGNSLTITRDTPFTQDVNFQVGRIDPEQVENTADLAVLRDQELSHKEDVTKEIADEAIETAVEAKDIAQDAKDIADAFDDRLTQAEQDASDAKQDASDAKDIAQDASDAVSAHIADTNNPHSVTKAQIGLGNCDNTADLDKPISTATQTALDTKATPADITSAVSTHNADLSAHSSIISPIQEVIPTAATSSNQLADKNFVNSSIATSTATFRGTYNSLAELEAQTADENDYGFVVSTDAAGNTIYNRYKYTTSTTPASWVFEYALNNSSFTAIQWDAINSGANTTNIGQIATNASAISSHTGNTSNPHNVTKAQVGLSNVDNTSDLDKPISTATQTALNGKQDAISDLATIRSNAQAGKAASDTIATYGDIVTHDVAEFATAAQGAKADTALQSGDNISELVNDAGYITGADITGKVNKTGDTMSGNLEFSANAGIYLEGIGSAVSSSKSRLNLGTPSNVYSYLTGNNQGAFGIYSETSGTRKGIACYPNQNFFADAPTKTIDLGRSNNVWKTVYANSISDGTNTETTANIISGASAGATAVQPGDNVSGLTNDAGYLVMGDLTNFVTKNTAQTISGLKTFSADIVLSDTTSIKNTTGGVSYTMMYRDTSGIHVGTSTQALLLAGSGTHPSFNGNNLALLSEIPTVPTTLAELTGDVNISSPTNGQHLVYDATTQKWKNQTSASTVSWGGITGSLSDQTDLKNALDTKLDAIDGATITKNSSDEIQAVGTVNQNTATGATNPIKSWLGDINEYNNQSVPTSNPDALCFIVDKTQTATDRYIVEAQYPDDTNGHTWYFLYSDGWVEQGGYSTSGTYSSPATTNLPVAMADTNYTLTLGARGEGNNTTSVAWRTKNTNSFTTEGGFNGTSPGARGFNWQVCGMAA